MILEIKKVRECREGEYGYFKPVGSERAYIAVSMKRNTTLDVYAATLLHELLHFWTALLTADGFKIKDGEEHRWINDCEKQIIKLMTKHIGRK